MKPRKKTRKSDPTIHLPDRYSDLSSYLTPDDNFVISRGVDGGIISRFGDDIWNVRIYDAKNTCLYNFTSWCKTESLLKKTITKELKIVQLARLYLARKPRKVNSLRVTHIRKLALLSINHNTTLEELLNNPHYYPSIITSFSALPPDSMRQILSLLRELFDIRGRHIAFSIAPPNHDLISRLETLYRPYATSRVKTYRQTKLIPSRIYAEIIFNFGAILDEFNKHHKKILRLNQNRYINSRYGVPEGHHTRSNNTTSWAYETKKLRLSPLFKKHTVENWGHLTSYLGKVQTAAKYWIHLFSGMRENEAAFLPYDTYASINTGAASFKILKGFTSKFSSQNHTPTFWITHEIVEKGIIAAQGIGSIAAVNCGWDDSKKSQYPLFPGRVSRRRNSGSAKRNTWHFKGAPAAGGLSERAQEALLESIPSLCITEEDIRELELFDGFRNWRDDPTLVVGAPWPLGTHQCRRSLAVYGARSGLLSLGSSALQFKQLTEAMASYYRKDSIFAVNFLQSDNAQSLMKELEREHRAAQFSHYEDNVINSTSRLWGGEGSRIQLAIDKGQPLIITTDRSITEKKFLKGEMVYKQSPIGGCTNLEHCDKISFTSILACIDCDKSILDENRSLRKIKRGVQNLVREQVFYRKDTPQYNQLQSEIDALFEKLSKRGLLEKMEALK
ncbi:hypothetical protein [Pseudomonas sp. NPDC086566]|uniref:hypothetical protein n=1 Tax=Pseudomonas sp. NPDC086566 TaxID=3390647 RepID=UPI003CFE2DD7